MITHIDTKNTSLILSVGEDGRLVCLHYGAKLKTRQDYSALMEKKNVPYGDMVAADRDNPNLGLEDVCLEASAPGRGDFREPMVSFLRDDGAAMADFRFLSHETLPGKPPIPGLPSSYAGESPVETHVFELADASAGLHVKLYYTAFYDCDVIARRAEYRNGSGLPMTLSRAMSAQLDLPLRDWRMVSFTGAWANERQWAERALCTGVFINDSKQGASSSRANPFGMLLAPEASEESGACYGYNLVYSGNHAEVAEQTHFGKTRLLLGINPFGFSWRLEPGEVFFAPEAITAFSELGAGGVSRCMHRFVRNHIVRGEWKNKPRPVLVNNWEGTWMDFDERKLLSIAKIGAELGAELFVMDDGWFGARDNDARGLGDWFVNTKKLPHGLDGLQKRLAEMGLAFGIWVEPEMVNENSDLYRMHPDWAVRFPGVEPCLGRNQLILDLTRPEVRNYIVNSMTRIFQSAEISYVKWDNNRNFSDCFTPSLPPARQGEFLHRYMLGLYEILAILAERFPHILFESCASGGNRFDLGMLCYMPQTWTSDNTDPLCRVSIQGGTSYGYPLSTMGAHVSASPSQSTLRRTQVETRFNVSAFGLLGYEMDLTELTPFDKSCIKEQIAFYKAHRELFQFGVFYRTDLRDDFGRCLWQVVSEDQKEASALFFEPTAEPSHPQDILLLKGLDPELEYQVEGRKQYISVGSFGSLVKHALPVKLKGDGVPMALLSGRYLFPMTEERYCAGGDMLMKSGLRLRQQFGGTGYNDQIRVLGDTGSRLYYIRAKEN